jgi:hypothetical protein
VTNRALLIATLGTAVPLWAAELSGTPLRRLLAGGPALARTIAESADALQFGGGREGRVAEAFNALARSLAILSFLPDGAKFCGVRFRHVHPDEEGRRQKMTFPEPGDKCLG